MYCDFPVEHMELIKGELLERKHRTKTSKTFAKMGIFRMMSVGRSGVGKSTIGNMFLFGKGKGGSDDRFPTSVGCESFTHDAKQLTNKDGDCAYIDVPGIPDTNSTNTAKFYDVIVNEAKNDLNVILFVFKRDRIDPAAYKLAELLFRELNKAHAMKILVINDHNSYKFENPPTEDEYKAQMKAIKQMTKIDFTHYLIFTAETMEERLKHLKVALSKTESRKSEHMKNFNELKQYVEDLRKKKNYKEEAIRLKKQRITNIRLHIAFFQVALVASIAGTYLNTVTSFFTYGLSLPFAAMSAMNIPKCADAVKIKKAELEETIKMIEAEDLTGASRELEEACEKFNELKASLQVN